MPEFVRASSKHLTHEELMDLLAQIAGDPLDGDVIPDSGGLRKTRVALTGRGKSGGGRVVYAYFGEDMPVFVFTFYPTNVKADLSQKDKQAIRKALPALVEEYRSGIRRRITKVKREGYDKEGKR